MKTPRTAEEKAAQRQIARLARAPRPILCADETVRGAHETGMEGLNAIIAADLRLELKRVRVPTTTAEARRLAGSKADMVLGNIVLVEVLDERDPRGVAHEACECDDCLGISERAMKANMDRVVAIRPERSAYRGPARTVFAEQFLEAFRKGNGPDPRGSLMEESPRKCSVEESRGTHEGGR